MTDFVAFYGVYKPVQIEKSTASPVASRRRGHRRRRAAEQRTAERGGADSNKRPANGNVT